MAGILHEMPNPMYSAYYARVRKFKGVIAGISVLVLAVGIAPAGQTDAFIRITPEQVPFKSATDAQPVQAVLFGDPSKPGLYVLRVRFPPGTHSNPHCHSQDRHVTVIKGVWWMGVGEKLDFKKTSPLKAGS